MNVKIEESWRKRLQEEFDKPYFEKLVAFVKSEYGHANVLPPGHQIFHVFNSCPFEKVKVVILGQDLILIPVSIMESAFRTERSSHSRFSGKHIQGNTSGPGKAHSDFRKSGPLGSARRVSYEFRPHSTCPRNRLAPEHGMGNLHRRCYQETE